MSIITGCRILEQLKFSFLRSFLLISFLRHIELLKGYQKLGLYAMISFEFSVQSSPMLFDN